MNIEKEIATAVVDRTGLKLTEKNVFESESFFYYIQEAIPNHPLFIHHYRGYFFLSIPKKDWEKLNKEEISAVEYVDSADWHYGYCWGGGSMVSGGYYTKLEKEPGIHNKKLINHVMTVISKMGRHLASGAELTEEDKKNWEEVKEKYLHDPRIDFFKEVDAFVSEKYNYQLKGMCCSERIDDNAIVLYPNYMSRTFVLYVSENTIRRLLFGEKVDYSAMDLYVGKSYSSKKHLITCAKDFEKALFGYEILRNWDEEEAISKGCKTKQPSLADDPENILTKLLRLFQK